LSEKIKGIDKLNIKADESVVDIIMEFGTEKKHCEIAHIRQNKTNPRRYDFTYLGQYAQAYDTLIDNEFEERIINSEQLKKLREKLLSRINEYCAKKNKSKKPELYSQLFQGREENGTFENVRNSILFFVDIFADKIDKFGKIYGEIK